MLGTAAVLAGLLLCCVEAQITFGCGKGYCDKAHCPDIGGECYGAREVLNASTCGCCHICVKPVEEGAKCEISLMATTPRWECGLGLMCEAGQNEEKGVCKVGRTACTRALNEFSGQVDGQELTQGRPRPKCDDLGYYQPVQCKPGMLCYCVNKNGDRIFGTAPYTEEKTMDCNCSRDLDQMISLKVLSKKDTRYFLRCSANGDYEGPQCTAENCYCINKKAEMTAQPIKTTSGKIDTLSCYDSKKHGPRFITACLREVEEWENLVGNFSEHNVTVVGLFRSDCDPDGSYAPKQCKDRQCYCVNKYGIRYKGDAVPRYTQEAEDMRCNCRREKDLLKNLADNKVSQIFASYKCSRNGNYLPIQCTSSFCVCVDEDGFQKQTPKSARNQKANMGLVSERENLDCYRPEYEPYFEFVD